MENRSDSLTPIQKRTLIASWAGFSLDSFSSIIYSLVITSVITAFHLTAGQAGLIGSVTLIATALGGVVFGIVADYIGRRNTMILGVLLFAIFSAVSALAQSYGQLMLARAMVGFGFAGEYTASMIMVTEVWPAHRRTTASALTQSGWAVGFFFATLANYLIEPYFGFRGVFWAGMLPAVFILYIRFGLPESKVWQETRKYQASTKSIKRTFSFIEIWKPQLLASTIIMMVVCTFHQMVYWGVASWLPAFLKSPISKGGVGLSTSHSLEWLLIYNVGSFLGYISFGPISEKIGRKRALYTFLIITVLVLGSFVFFVRNEMLSFLLSPIIGFFGTGYISAFGAMFTELFPTTSRATAQGFIYNFGRIGAAIIPWIQGLLVTSYGFTSAMMIPVFAAIVLVISIVFVRDTQGQSLSNFTSEVTDNVSETNTHFV